MGSFSDIQGKEYTVTIKSREQGTYPRTMAITLAGDPVTISYESGEDSVSAPCMKSKAIVRILQGRGHSDIVSILDEAEIGDARVEVSDGRRIVWSGIYSCEMVSQIISEDVRCIELLFIDAVTYLQYLPMYKRYDEPIYATVSDIMLKAMNAVRPYDAKVSGLRIDATWYATNDFFNYRDWTWLKWDVRNMQREESDGKREECSYLTYLTELARYMGYQLRMDFSGEVPVIALSDMNFARRRYRYWKYLDGEWSLGYDNKNSVSSFLYKAYGSVSVSKLERVKKSRLKIQRQYQYDINNTDALGGILDLDETEMTVPSKWLFFDPDDLRVEDYWTKAPRVQAWTEQAVAMFRNIFGQREVNDKYFYIRQLPGKWTNDARYNWYSADSKNSQGVLVPNNEPYGEGHTTSNVASAINGWGLRVFALAMARSVDAKDPTSTALQWTKCLAMIDCNRLGDSAPSGNVSNGSWRHAVVMSHRLNANRDNVHIQTNKACIKINMRLKMPDPINGTGISCEDQHMDGGWVMDGDKKVSPVIFYAVVNVKANQNMNYYWNGSEWTMTWSAVPLIFESTTLNGVFDNDLVLTSVDKGVAMRDVSQESGTSRGHRTSVVGAYEIGTDIASDVAGMEIPLSGLPWSIIDVGYGGDDFGIWIEICRPGPFGLDGNLLTASTNKFATAVYITQYTATILVNRSSVQESLYPKLVTDMQSDVVYEIGSQCPDTSLGVREETIRFGLWENDKNPQYSFPLWDTGGSTILMGGTNLPIHNESCFRYFIGESVPTMEHDIPDTEFQDLGSAFYSPEKFKVRVMDRDSGCRTVVRATVNMFSMLMENSITLVFYNSSMRFAATASNWDLRMGRIDATFREISTAMPDMWKTLDVKSESRQWDEYNRIDFYYNVRNALRGIG